MFSTYKAMTTSLSSDLKKKTAEELCFQYAQAKTNAEKHRIIRTMFVKLFPMIVTIYNKYDNVPDEDRAAHALTLIWYSIEKFNELKKTKFSTFYYNNLENAYRTSVTYYNAKKRSLWKNMINTEQEKITYILDSIKSLNYESTDDYYLDNIFRSSKLSVTEKAYCQAILEGYTKSDEVIERLRLKDRFKNTPISNPISGTMSPEDLKKAQDDAVERQAKKYLSKLQKDLRTKIIKNKIAELPKCFLKHKTLAKFK